MVVPLLLLWWLLTLTPPMLLPRRWCHAGSSDAAVASC